MQGGESPPNSSARSKQVTLAPKHPSQRRCNQGHAAQRPPKSGAGVQQWNDIEVHANNGGNQIQGQENGSDRGQGPHALVGSIALCVEVNLNGRLNALLEPPHVVHHAVDVFQHIATSDFQNFVFTHERTGGGCRPTVQRL